MDVLKLMDNLDELGNGPVSIGSVQFDALLDISEKFDATVPMYRTDMGYETSDDIIPNLMVVDMRLFVTPTPVTWSNRPSHVGRNPRDAVDALRALLEQRKPVFVSTKKKNYDNMMIQKVSVNKTADIGYALEIDVSMVQLTKAAFGEIIMHIEDEFSEGTVVGEPLTVGSEDGAVILSSFIEGVTNE